MAASIVLNVAWPNLSNVVPSDSRGSAISLLDTCTSRQQRRAEGDEEGARVHRPSAAYGCTHGDPSLQARSGVEAMS